MLMLTIGYSSRPDRGRENCRIASGKAPKQIILLIYAVGRKLRNNPAFKEKLRISYPENYNVALAELIIPAADLSEQISTAGWEASGTGNMKLAMNGALTIGTEDGANIEMRQAATDRWWPFRFGSTAEENAQPYNPWDIYIHDEGIRKAVDSLKDRTCSENQEEAEAFAQIYQSLIEHDTFKVLKDLRAYAAAQKKAEALYLDRAAWAETALHNIAAMGRFSTDVSIRNYAEKVWGAAPCPPDPQIVAKVREEYSEHDRCKIHP